MSQRSPYTRLAALCDPRALCDTLPVVLTQQPCQHDFTLTRACLITVVPADAVQPVIALIQELGAGCDCEVVNTLCPRIISGREIW